jgi:hypothetical protein
MQLSGNAPNTRSSKPAWAWIFLIGAFFLTVLVSVWLSSSSREPDPRNTPENLLTNDPGMVVRNLPGLPPLKTELSPDELAFGERQVNQMVADRPALARGVSTNDALWQFCVRAFAGETIGEPILWKNAEPRGDEYQSDHQGPYRGQRGYIRIRKNCAYGSERGQPASCEQLWSCAVFEIENMRNSKAFDALFKMALRGEVSREEWTRENSRLEYEALRRTAEDYRRLWRPLVLAGRVSSTAHLWGANIPQTYESWISRYRDPNSYPWDVYARDYDRQIMPYVRSRMAFRLRAETNRSATSISNRSPPN